MPAERKRKPDVRRRPGEIRDAIVNVLSTKPRGASIREIHGAVRDLIGSAAPSSIRSYLRLNSDSLFRRRDRGVYTIRETPAEAYGLKAARQPPSRSSSSADQSFSRLIASNGCENTLRTRSMRWSPTHLTAWSSTPQSNKKNFTKAKVESGESRPHSTVQSARRCRVSRSCLRRIWTRLEISFSAGAAR